MCRRVDFIRLIVCCALTTINAINPPPTLTTVFGNRKHVNSIALFSKGDFLEIGWLTMSREAFNDIYLNLSRKPGATRFSDSGFGWKPANGETYTCDQSQILQAQWSRAARGYEIKILSRSDGVIQLDGFKQEVRWRMRRAETAKAKHVRISTVQRSSSRFGTA